MLADFLPQLLTSAGGRITHPFIKLHSQHLDEIKQSLHQLQSDFSSELHFIPMRGAFTRGILAASYLTTTMSLREAEIYIDSIISTIPLLR